MNTILITKSEVPTYLQSGEFYKSLSDDEDHEQFSVPSNTLKADTTVQNNADLLHLLTGLRFWGVGIVQEKVIKYCLPDLEYPCDDILQEFTQDFPSVALLMSVLLARKEDKLMIAVTSGILEIVRDLPSNLVITVDCCRAAARAGNLDILQCLHERGGVLDSSVLHAALEGGNGLACVQYLRAQGVEWPRWALVTALKAGSKECFHYALQDGCTWGLSAGVKTLYKDQYADVLKYAIQHGCPVDVNAVWEVVRVGAVKCLQVLHEQGCPMDEFSCTLAASNDHLDCLQYLHENGCPWDEKTVYWAVTSNHIECVQYALQQDCPVFSNSCYAAAYKRFLHILQCLYEEGVPWGDTCENATVSGHLDCLQYAHEHGAPWDVNTCTEAARYGHLDYLQYAHDNGCPWDLDTCTEAARGGYLDCLQYAHHNGCPWNVNTCTAAARNGHVDCLQYAHENGCPCDENTFRSTLQSGQLECLKYLLESGCPINMKECDEVVQRGRCSQEAEEMIRSFHPNLL